MLGSSVPPLRMCYLAVLILHSVICISVFLLFCYLAVVILYLFPFFLATDSEFQHEENKNKKGCAWKPGRNLIQKPLKIYICSHYCAEQLGELSDVVVKNHIIWGCCLSNVIVIQGWLSVRASAGLIWHPFCNELQRRKQPSLKRQFCGLFLLF